MRQQSAGDKDAEAPVLILAAAARPGASRIIGLAETAENSDVEPRPVVGDAQHHRLLVPGKVDLDAVAGELRRVLDQRAYAVQNLGVAVGEAADAGGDVAVPLGIEQGPATVLQPGHERTEEHPS